MSTRTGRITPRSAKSAAAVRFSLHPPVQEELRYRIDEVLILASFSSGRCAVAIGSEPRKTIRIRAGSVMVAPPGVNVQVRPSEPIEFLALEVAPEHMATIAERAGEGRTWTLRPLLDVLDPAITAVSGEIRRALLADPLIESGYLELLADAILARLTCSFLTEPDVATEAETIAPGPLARLARHIEDHLGETLKVDDLATFVGLSRAHFSRAFKRSTGDGPQRYILKRRINRARELLADGETPLSDIAASAGFSSQAHMTKAFRDELGLTPLRYRQAFTKDDR